MKLVSSKKRVAAISAVTAATLLSGGAAYAYWTTTGSGTGSATTAPASASVTVSQASLSGPLYPGDAAQTLNLTVTNDSTTQNAYVTSLTATITTTAGASCDASNYLINGVAATTPNTLIWTGQDLAHGASAINADNTIQFNNKPTGQNPCKGAAVTITYAAS